MLTTSPRLSLNAAVSSWPRASTRTAGSLSPWAIFPLILPFGLTGGYLTVALIFLLSQRGVSAAEIGGMLFIILIPQTVKFLYAPMIDTTLGPRRWYAIGVVFSAGSLLAIAFVPPVPASLALLTIVGFISIFAITLVSMPTDIIMAYDVAPDHKGRAAGWSMAASLGGSAIGGGLALWLTSYGLPSWTPPVVLAALCLLCLPFVLLTATREPFAADAGWIEGQRRLLRDIWDMVRSRIGAQTLLLAILPIGTGAMQNLLPVIARDWNAGATQIALVSGGASGILQIVGALVGGRLCDRFNRRFIYCGAGASLALTSIAMAMGPRNATAFVALSLIYVFILGISYAALGAAVLEAIGKGAAASKYTLIICVSNFAIFAEGGLEGWVHDKFSVTTMLFMEALAGLAAITIFAGVAIVSDRGRGTTTSVGQLTKPA